MTFRDSLSHTGDSLSQAHDVFFSLFWFDLDPAFTFEGQPFGSGSIKEFHEYPTRCYEQKREPAFTFPLHSQRQQTALPLSLSLPAYHICNTALWNIFECPSGPTVIFPAKLSVLLESIRRTRVLTRELITLTTSASSSY